MAVPARAPDLRERRLIAGASRSYARSPRRPRLRSDFCTSPRRSRSPLLSASRSRGSPCGLLGSLRSAPQEDFHLPSHRSCWAHIERAKRAHDRSADNCNPLLDISDRHAVDDYPSQHDVTVNDVQIVEAPEGRQCLNQGSRRRARRSVNTIPAAGISHTARSRIQSRIVVAENRVTAVAMSKHMPSVDTAARARLTGVSVFTAQLPFV